MGGFSGNSTGFGGDATKTSKNRSANLGSFGDAVSSVGNAIGGAIGNALGGDFGSGANNPGPGGGASPNGGPGAAPRPKPAPAPAPLPVTPDEVVVQAGIIRSNAGPKPKKTPALVGGLAKSALTGGTGTTSLLGGSTSNKLGA